ncbi:CTLH/CRA C-terminal to lish motif domain-containing protein [Syncephalis fuscata]|nr:CTLH/CRA C-terminal to lish motif domain-containing protein [Syncephalis fuscata]
METLKTTIDEFQCVKDAVNNTREQELKYIDALLAEIAETKRTITEDSSMANNALSSLFRLTQEANTKVNDSHKTQQNVLSKYVRVLDKKYKLELDLIADTATLNGNEHAILEAVCLHFLIHGEFELANSLIEESNINVLTSTRDNYARLFSILAPLRQNDLVPALSWAAQHRGLVSKERENNLEFALHRLRYLQLLKSGDVYAALTYARDYFGLFCKKQLKDIPRLMGALLYAGRLDDSPYADMINDDEWKTVEQLFRAEYCTALNLPSESPLYTSVVVGTTAIPSIIKMSQVMKTNRTEWTQQDELPVSIPIPDSVRFHSTFVCPVSKDYGTIENPPMRMPCGHVIGYESLMKLSNHDQTRFKCPYCPSESGASQAMRIYF